MKKNKALLLIIIAILVFACGKSNKSSAVEGDHTESVSGYQIFKKHCRLCHGSDGKLGLNGAKSIPESTLSLEERIAHIRNGKGAMQPYKDILSAEEIKAVAEFTLTLGKN